MKAELAIAVSTLVHTISALPQTSTYNFQERCNALATSLQIPQAQVSLAEFVAEGSTLQFANPDITCGRPTQNVSANLCRVALIVATSNRSSVSIETWLPENWSGRFLSTGNGGLGGCIQYEDMDYATSMNFATVGTNNGHNGMSGESFLNNPDVVEDFAYRALHTGVVIGKQISAAFYEAPHNKSYYLGCSTGGRQGFKEAQRFPEDFDGIVAGAPAFSFNNLTSWSCHFLPLTGVEGADTFVPLDMWPIIHADILEQCDALDGLKDGILESPDLCNYTPDSLICPTANNSTSNSTGCLTPIQASTVRDIFSPLLDTDGSIIYPRMQPGNELVGAPATYYSGQPFGAADWFRYVIFNDSNWDPLSLVPADYRLASSQNPFNIETFDGDLTLFKDSGAKLLHYHGLADQTISSENSQRYYEHVSSTMGLAPQELDDFYRLFRISGMAHCGGGPGAVAIGNGGRNLAGLDPQDNILMAMVQWVEQGIAPETVTGTAFVNGDRSQGVAFKRDHCRWPRRNKYNGAGDPNLASSWSCIV